MAEGEQGGNVVISGIAGRFPDSDNVGDLKENLFNKVDLVSDDERRWKTEHPEVPQRTGKVNNINKFDAVFFSVNSKLARVMDPMGRMLLEHAYEAIIDAGVNPRQLRGTNTGVIIGSYASDSQEALRNESNMTNGMGLIGNSFALLANRISFWLGVHGPSYNVDTACSSSLFAMEHALRAIRNGLCDAALVGSCNLCLHPIVSLQFSRLGLLSPEGCCKSFDNDGNGYVRSEAVVMVFLQKSKDAKRIYANFVHGKTNFDGFKEKGITHPCRFMQARLLRDLYQECGVPPSSVSFVEAHGTGTKVGDPEELNALQAVFCPGRRTPLRIGAIKSNLGHTEATSGMCGIAKVIIAMETGFIPPNLHYKRPREGIKALEDGRLEVVTELTALEGDYVGVNSFGFGGANAHILLKSNTKEKVKGGAPNDELPRLVVVSGRTEEAVNFMLNEIQSRPVDVEYVRLLHDIHAEEIRGHLYRGYVVMPPRGIPETPLRGIEHYPDNKRPVWFVFSGMGSQWVGMGEALMKIPVFAKAVLKCDAVLKPHGLDIIDILTSKDTEIFGNILHSFVGIAAVQIGLVDVLRTVGIEPDQIIGHSVGELGCAYADGCLTADQMILSSYMRGLASVTTKVIRGSMAAVGLGYNSLKDLCPQDIEVACHNGPESSTISGPAESMKSFLSKLQKQDIFAKDLYCGDIAYHSSYIKDIGPKLLAYLKQVIPDPRPRSSKWLSTSIPRDKWSTEAAALASADYFTNNLLSPVLFEETLTLIPNQALTIEIAPHGLLQTILRRSLNQEVTNIALAKRGHEDSAQVLLQSLGKLYQVGLHPQLKNLYPEVQFPVSRGTPMISPVVKWDHSDDWFVGSFKIYEKVRQGLRQVEVSLEDEEYAFMAGHVIDGRNLFPAAGYLVLIWQTVAMMREECFDRMSIVFQDVRFLRAIKIPEEGVVKLTAMLQKGTGRFEVNDGDAAVVTGMFRVVTKPMEERTNPLQESGEDEEEIMTPKDVYKELRLRGYQYSGLFRGVRSSTTRGSKGRIAWDNNWVAFIDNMLQMAVLRLDSRELYVPTGIRKIVIDHKLHSDLLSKAPEEQKEFPVRVFENLDVITAGGVEIRGLKATAIARRRTTGNPVLEQYSFIAHRDKDITSLRTVTHLAMHLALENQLGIRVKTLELVDRTAENVSATDLVSPILLEVLGNCPLIQADVNVIAPPEKFEINDLPADISISVTEALTRNADALLVIGKELFSGGNSVTLEELLSALKDGSFLLAREALGSRDLIERISRIEGLDFILEKRTEDELVILLRRREKLPNQTVVIEVNNVEFSWLTELKAAMKAGADQESSDQAKILLVAQGDVDSGLLGLVNCLRKEPEGQLIRALMIQDPNAPAFSLQNPLYADQLKLDMVINVLRPGNIWGTYRHLPLAKMTPSLVHHATIHQTVRGDLSSLHWLEGPIQSGYRDKDLVRVAYSSINFRDVILTTGKIGPEIAGGTRLQQECVIGMEYSGLDSNGKAVMGVTHPGAFTNLHICHQSLQWDVPDGWTLEDAATVPTTYGTCYYAMYICGRFKKGDRVLIHAGSGGVGQAAINLALHEGCEVFTTVGTAEKREFIRKNFPQIDERHIGNSRDTSFERMVLEATNGRGVDFVLNSLAEEKLQASIRCLAHRGKFMEIGKFDMVSNNSIGMEAFLKEISFHGILLEQLMNSSADVKIKLRSIFAEGLRSGAVKPLSRTIFPKDQLESAFRYMAMGKHIGKVLISVRDANEHPETPILALPRFNCLEEHSYVILGGLGGFGLELADWLIIRGARKLVLTSRRGLSNGYQRSRIRTWQGYGAKVLVVAAKDTATREGCEELLQAAASLGPVDAIFNLAMVLKDGLCENQTIETFAEPFRAKAWSTAQLDQVSRILCPQLRHFVVFSSVSCSRGHAGQTNYGMANSAMERICERRVAEGLPGLAIQWGAIDDVGLVADRMEDNEEVVIAGTLPQRISSCLQELDVFLKQSCPVVASMVVAGKSAAAAKGTSVLETVMNIMGLKDLKSVSQHIALSELGMDSLLGVEIKQTLEREFNLFLTMEDIRKLNLSNLSEMGAKGVEECKSIEVKAKNDLTAFNLLVHRVFDDNFLQEIVLKLPSLSGGSTSEVFLIPGLEGNGFFYKSLATNVKAPVTCLQFIASQMKIGSIASMAEFFVPHVLPRLKDRRGFVIVGFSFGGVVAVELARCLENKGLNGRLVLIDGAPAHFQTMLNEHMGTPTDDQLQSNILLELMNILTPASSNEISAILKNYSMWEERLAKFLAIVPQERLSISREDLAARCTGFYNRCKAGLSYDSSVLPQIFSPIILLKPEVPSVQSIPEDYGLQNLTSGKVQVHYAEGNHFTVLKSSRVFAAINGEPLDVA